MIPCRVIAIYGASDAQSSFELTPWRWVREQALRDFASSAAMEHLRVRAALTPENNLQGGMRQRRQTSCREKRAHHHRSAPTHRRLQEPSLAHPPR